MRKHDQCMFFAIAAVNAGETDNLTLAYGWARDNIGMFKTHTGAEIHAAFRQWVAA